MIKMAFNSEGQLLGFELRVDMFPIAFEFDEYNFKIVMRALKACINLNRILKHGLDDD